MAYKLQYSGKASSSFWRKVSKIKKGPRRTAAYQLGCALQDLELIVQRMVDNGQPPRARR